MNDSEERRTAYLRVVALLIARDIARLRDDTAEENLRKIKRDAQADCGSDSQAPTTKE